MSNNATPLIALLRLYSKASYVCDMDYMEGLHALYKYLAPVELPEAPKAFRYSSLLTTYNIMKLSNIIAKDLVQGDCSKQLDTEAKVERAIVYSLIKDTNL